MIARTDPVILLKHLLYIIGVILLLGCGERQEYREALSRAEAVMGERPDSALLILDSLGQHESEFGRHFRMQYLLHHMNAENKTDVIFTSDSLAKELVDHFDRHGTTNEQVLAHYLLGRAYSDMGEAPQAVANFQNAIDAADTIATDFNFYLLSCVYSQMAEIYRRQLLLSYEIESRRHASHFAFRANQIKWVLYNQAMSAGAYILMNKKDSAEILLKSVIEKYRKYGYTQEALRYSRSLIHLYTEGPKRLKEAKAMMDQFEAESELFDEHHELPPSQRQYYYYKGLYYEGIHCLDSAEYYYRKMYYLDMPYIVQDPMYKGLLSVFSKRHMADSIAKYAQLYGLANDSSVTLKDQNLIAQMAASYRYSRLQEEVHRNELKAYRTLIVLILSIVLMVIVSVASLLLWRSHRKRYQQKIDQLKTEFADTTEEYEENLHKLQLLESSHQKVISIIQEELLNAQNESTSFKEKYDDAQKTIVYINQEYESEKARLLDENSVLQERIRELQKEEILSKHLSVSESFAKEIIVRRIHEIAKKPVIPVTDEEWNELTKIFGNTYPDLFHDLCQRCDSPQSVRVCILTVLGIGSNEQANMLGTTIQRVSNIKSALNKALFNETSSRSFHKNLVVRYNIYGFEYGNSSK